MNMFSEMHARMNLIDNTMRESNGNHGEVLKNDLEKLLQEQCHEKYNDIFINKESDMNINCSGSAPPSIEGSLSAIDNEQPMDQNLSIDNYYNGADRMPSTTTTNTNSISSEEEIQSHLTYLSQYCSTKNHNPRLPPPLLSREHWHMAQRLHQSFGGVADWTPRVNNETANAFNDGADDERSSLFSMQPILSSSALETVDEHNLMGISNSNTKSTLSPVSLSTERLDRWPDGSIKLPSGGTRLGMRRPKSFSYILQEGLDQPTPTPSHLSRPASHSCLSNIVDKTDTIYDPRTENLHNDKGMPRVQSFESLFSHSALSAQATTLSGCTTPDRYIIGWTSSPHTPTAIKKVTSVENLKNISSMNTLNRVLSSSLNNLSDIAASVSSLSPSNDQFKHEKCHMLYQHGVRFDDDSNALLNMKNNTLNRCLSSSMNNIADIAASISCRSQSINGVKHENFHALRQQKVRFDDDSNMLLNSFSFPKGYDNVKMKNDMMEEQNDSVLGFDGTLRKSSACHCLKTPPGFTKLKKSNNLCQTHTFSSLSSPVKKPSGCSIDKKLELSSYLNEGGSTLVDGRNQQSIQMKKFSDPLYIQAIASSTNSSQGSSAMLQKLHEDSCAEPILAQMKNQYNPLLEKSTDFFHHPYYPNPGFGLNVVYNGNAAIAESAVALGLYGNTIMPNRGNSGFNTIASKGNLGDVLTCPLLEELKSNTTRPLELVDIVDNVYDFSTDQNGSRFIQQKLETATVEEKTEIFHEILSHARALTTDVFGNYVVQKFFEHGTESQRKDLAGQLVGHVLPLSLQLYGCRVIQKALEVVDVEQQTTLVAELDGSIIKCVCDQSGNHVIQKCIQCIPQDRIQFIIESFFGQIATLSTHLYGCRVIQRVLEHCNDPKANKIIMEEIVHSACTLAQDQYGNYVVQHVLQHGKAHEQSAIIKKLAGQIVKMSKQKFASNVIEKCLTFGEPEDRQLIVKEMLGTTDDNEPLQAMTKDPFGNYVVQKVLETCDGQSCELIVSRLKYHLSALKRYTYSKHIVSRIEKLIAAGEGRGGVASPSIVHGKS